MKSYKIFKIIDILVKAIKPNKLYYINMDYSCNTCGSKDGKSNIENAHCHHCGSDNWEQNN